MVTMAEIRKLERHCREAAKDMVSAEYDLYDRIWTERIRITDAIFDHGKDTVREINSIMPNLLCYNRPELRTLDETANDFGFESTSALVKYLLAYTPKREKAEKYYEELFGNCLREMVLEDISMETKLSVSADVPF